MGFSLNRRNSSIPSSNDNQYGISSRIALNRLHDEIESVLQEHEKQFLNERYYRKVCLAFIDRYESPLGWVSIITSLLTVVALLFGKFYLAAFALLFISLLDLIIVIRESNLRRTEVYRKSRLALHDIHLAAQIHCNEWQSCNYPNLYSPLSPCISMQWTYRDGQIINLPWSLLVKGDCIVLRPGQMAPGPCYEIDGQRKFKTGEMYGAAFGSQPIIKPVARTPLPNLLCHLETTPFLDNFSKILQNNHKRPPTIYNQQRYLLVTKYIQQWGFMLSICITIVAISLKFYGVCLFSLKHDDPWLYIFVESCTAAVIPLLPLVFPLMWISINLWGIARLDCFLQSPQLLKINNLEKNFEEDLDTSIFNYENTALHSCRVFYKWLHLWLGDSKLLGRSANVVQVLGSITALCCVDKKGILSWPNPTAEKVFFLRENYKVSNDDDKSDFAASMQLENDPADNNIQKKIGAIPEVLDLTHDQYCPFRLEFDDHDWINYIKSLKPLGLAILLNTCSTHIHPLYTQFCGHVNAVATLNKGLVPISNRRCLCELAKQIGFTDHATNCFDLEGLLATYSKMQSNILQNDIGIERRLQTSTKIPFPHSLSAVMRDNHGGYLSLFTQGTADIVLDCCDDFWDGKDLRPLTQQDRKRALDFYQRSALTAYCTAFAYKPLRHCIKPPNINTDGKSNIVYLEFPSSFKISMQQSDAIQCDLESSRSKLSHSLSTDSLLPSENDSDINNIEKCFDMQCHQVFIGMVTMQYQAQTDIVQLVERLERACIRFVHFSKENELRSRVFSEKMGLESGWNCHISLLSESDNNISLHSPRTQNATASNGKNIASTSLMGRTLDLFPNKIPKFNRNKIKITQYPCASSSNIYNMFQKSTHTSTIINNESTNWNTWKSAFNQNISKALSSSAPCTILNHNYNSKLNAGRKDYSSSINLTKSQSSLTLKETLNQHDSATATILNRNCNSTSILTDSTEPSAAVNFDMSNRAKLPVGIKNIRPHLEEVDNVPLQVSLFTDCSPEATRQMLEIMQSYGEIVVCLGSSASNSNVNIFLQADCSIAVEPLYPQVCQNIEAYTEENLQLHYLKLKNNNASTDLTSDLLPPESKEKQNYKYTKRMWPTQGATAAISPIYLSRVLNSLPCSISVKREDSLSLVAIIELSRMFSSGLWNCIQFWACCAASLSLINVLCSCLSLPALLTPLIVIYLMCIPVPLISLALSHMDLDLKIMYRATGKKQTKYDTGVFGFVLWCYGCKFMTPTLMMMLYYYTLLSYHVEGDSNEINFQNTINVIHFARVFSLLGVLIHFVIISSTFVHRDYLLWQKNPFRNRIWSLTCLSILLIHITYSSTQIILHKNIFNIFRKFWPLIGFLYISSIMSLSISEICKWQEIKIHSRHQRRARLDFGTKLGMNSPF